MNIAIWISIVAVIISGISLGWNIYRDIILKPSLKTDISFGSLIPSPTGGNPSLLTSKSNPRGPRPFIVIEGVNHGPGAIRCTAIRLRATDDEGGSLPRVLLHDTSHEASDALPCTIEPGQPIHLALPYVHDCFLQEPIVRIGIKDSFDRIHWAPKRSLAEMKEQYRRDFGSQTATASKSTPSTSSEAPDA